MWISGWVDVVAAQHELHLECCTPRLLLIKGCLPMRHGENPNSGHAQPSGLVVRGSTYSSVN